MEFNGGGSFDGSVKKVIGNQPVLNKDALINPEALDFYAGLKELQEG